MLAVCACAFGSWIYDQDLVDAAPTTVVESPLEASADWLSEANNATEESQASSDGQSRRQESASTQPKSAQRRNQQSEDDQKADQTDQKVVIDGDLIDAGNVNIRKDRIIAPNVNITVPEPPNMRPDYPMLDPRRMTPEQRRKMQML